MSRPASLVFAAALVLSAVSGLAGSAVAGRALGAAIPPNAPPARLAEVMAAPDRYDGKDIVLRGTVSAQCASLCEFTFQDGPHKALIYPQGFKLPRLKKGEAVTLLARVTAGERNVVLTALGLRRK